jgi:hypothetical protein
LETKTVSKSLIELIQDNDPSYNPIETARIAAGIDVDTMNAAVDRVFYDGYYGPISPIDWEEEDGRKPYSVSEAIEILRNVAENVEDYWDKDDGEFGFDYNSRVDSYDIVKDAWPFLTEIYGSLPF